MLMGEENDTIKFIKRSHLDIFIISRMTVRISGRSVRVVEHSGVTIDELVGNVATKNDELSVAMVNVRVAPASEPWLTLHYDEWMSVVKGYIEIHEEDESKERKITRVNEGETVFISKGSRFQPVFPVVASYIPTCLPAFAPDRCIREEGTELSDVSKRLNELHSKEVTDQKVLSADDINSKYDNVKTIYHMAQKSLWDQCSKRAYFPPSFKKDGFTHATAIASTLIDTANHFYTDTKGEWICIELDRDALQKLGIVTIFEGPAPVGDIETNKNWNHICPHVYGGLPAHIDGVVKRIYPMTRDVGGKFLSIEGLVE